jgi:hypothetical protein
MTLGSLLNWARTAATDKLIHGRSAVSGGSSAVDRVHAPGDLDACDERHTDDLRYATLLSREAPGSREACRCMEVVGDGHGTRACRPDYPRRTRER